MAGTIVLLEMHSWERVGLSLHAAYRKEGSLLVALDPVTASRLKERSIPFIPIGECAPNRQWDEINGVLFPLVTPNEDLDAVEKRDVRDTFSHYLISEVNLLFDLLCRIQSLVEKARPEVLCIAAEPEASLADDLYDVACQLPWPANLRIERWDLNTRAQGR